MLQAAWACEAYMDSTSAEHNLPPQLLQAIGLVESGRKVGQNNVAWPWTINANGEGQVFATKKDAIAAVLKLRHQGVSSIDVGCMQINLKHHPHAFKNLEEAFDPQSNVAYAAKFLGQLYTKWQGWRQAIARYHSANAAGIQYLQRVFQAWGRPYQTFSPLKSNKITCVTRVVRRSIPLQ